MHETYRMLGKEHEADLEREALKWRRAAEVPARPRAGDGSQHGLPWQPIHDRTRGAIHRLALRLGPLTLAFALLLLAAPSASAYERPPLLQTVAGSFALRSAEVRCPSMEEWISDPIWGTSPNPSRAWGYTEMLNEYIVLHPALCAGAMAVSDSTRPLWQRATGTLVLVHEAYHLRRWKWRRNEAKVECQAIRHFISGAERLGASPELANDLLPFALAAHARMVALFPEYRDPKCRLPVWQLPMTP